MPSGSSEGVVNEQNVCVGSCVKTGPLVDDSDPYWAIEKMELYFVSNKRINPLSITSKPVEFAEYNSM